jgi:hypothetical protein
MFDFTGKGKRKFHFEALLDRSGGGANWSAVKSFFGAILSLI